MTRWLIWTSLLIVWAVALEFPVPDPGQGPAGEFVLHYKFVIGKTAHVCVYALLAVLGGWAPMPARYRWIVMFVLLAHAWGTEMLQEVLEPWCHRGGTLADVGIDIVGIALGTAASWKWWTKEECRM